MIALPLTICSLAKLSDSHGLFLDIVLGKQTRLACDHLLNWCWDQQIINIIIRLPGYPIFRRNYLEK